MSKIVDNRAVTLDSLFDGRLRCYQYQNGYRFSIDSVLVSHFFKPKKNEDVLDLGSGCGVVGLLLLHRYAQKLFTVTGLEKQADLVAISRKNIVTNNYGKKFEIIEGDAGNITDIFQPESFSMVISNPPFFVKNSGRLNKNRESMAARHQDDGTLTQFIRAAAYCLKNRGRFVTIYPAGSLTELLVELKTKKIEPKRIRFVYPYPEDHVGAKLVLVEGLKNGGGGAQVEPPLYVHQFKNGPHTEEIMKMYES